MWTAELKSHRVVETMVEATVVFTSDKGETITELPRGDNLDADQLKVWAARRIASLQARDDAAATLVAGPIVIEQKSAEEIAADAFFVKLADYNAAKVSVEKGFLKETDPAFQAKAVAVKAAYLPEYEKDQRFG